MPLIYIALSWILGILLAERLNFRAESPLWAALALSLAFLIIWLVRGRRPPRLRLLALILLALPLGALRYEAWPQSDALAALAGRGGVTLFGVVARPPGQRGAALQFPLDVEAWLRDGELATIRGRVWVRAQPIADLQYGDYLLAQGQLRLPPEYDSLSYSDHLARQSIYTVLTSARLERLGRDTGNPLRRALATLQGAAATKIARHLPEPEAGLLAGILLGDEGSISPELRDAFSRVGAAHIIAISGFNMTLLSALLGTLLQHWGLQQWRLLWVLLLWIVLYTILVGASLSVLRAALMSALWAVGFAMRRRVLVWTSLAFSTILLTLLNPTIIGDVGFQMSAAGVLGIGFFLRSRPWAALPMAGRTTGVKALSLRAWLRRLPRRSYHNLLAILRVTLAASFFTLPLAAAHFGRVSPWWLLVNLAIVPAQGIALGLGLLATLIGFLLPSLAALPFWVAWLPLHWTTTLVRFFDDLPFASLEIRPAPAVVVFWLLLIFTLMLVGIAEPRLWRVFRRWLRQTWLFVAACLLALVFLVLLWMRWEARPDGHLHLWFLDVGQSNGLLLQTPSGTHLLIDGGRYPERLLRQVGERLPFYDRRLEVLILTQPDERDVFALTELLQRYEVGLIVENGQPMGDERLTGLRAAIQQKETATLRAGMQIQLDEEVHLQVLHPREAPALTDKLDDGALVLLLRHGAVTFLLAGDSSVAAQDSWLMELAPVTVLQLPQHGAERSLHEDLFERTAAQVYVLQVDPRDMGFRPLAAELATLSTDNTLLRTDESGVLHFRSDGERLEIVGER